MSCPNEPQPDGLNVVEAAPMQLLPGAPGTCPMCAVAHRPEDPHDAQSLFYRMRFYQTHGRWPRWSDALMHCGERTTWNWVGELRRRGLWTTEDDAAMNDGTAVAEPTK